MDLTQLHWYDWNRGWEGTQPGWHEHVTSSQDTTLSSKLHEEVIIWLFTHVDNPKRHCRWTRQENKIHVKFRYERDYIWFKLSW